jgi:predicted restriction endonuclease
VLEAAHIIPVKYKGTDHFGNGFCLRADLHNLFDAKHLRIAPDSTIVLSEIASQSQHYRNLPRRIDIPNYVNREAIYWRWKYY